MMTRITRAEVEKIVAKARAENKTPNLRGANLRAVDLCGADLQAADLRGADLWDADLRGANLRGADLRDANLRGANLYNCIWDGLQITQPPYGQVILTPTCKGWWMSIGCWDGTPEELKTLISKDEGGIEAGDENHLPCSYLEAVFALCEAYMADNSQVIEYLKAKWGHNEGK
ncbi:pentapeptide repeat-containing protein [Corynebacterium diphtheriae]|nr:pentapeptide repeat-containing protein [Corynebacterium diphtheriae]